MTLIDELMSALGAARSALNGLGEEPKGDVPGLRALASQCRAEADLAASAASGAGSLPRSLVFSGPAASQLGANAWQVQAVAASAASDLNAAADQIKVAADKIDKDQKQWKRDRERLQNAVESIAAQVRSAN